MNKMGMSIDRSSKQFGGSQYAPSVSNAGSKAIGGQKAATGNINISIKGQLGMLNAPIDIAEDLGNETWNTALQDVRGIREKLTEKAKATKKKKKKKKRGGLATKSEAATDYDDALSYYTKLSIDENDFGGILMDYMSTNYQAGNAPREFNA